MTKRKLIQHHEVSWSLTRRHWTMYIQTVDYYLGKYDYPAVYVPYILPEYNHRYGVLIPNALKANRFPSYYTPASRLMLISDTDKELD